MAVEDEHVLVELLGGQTTDRGKRTDDLGRHCWHECREHQENDNGDHQQHAAEIKPAPLTPAVSMTPVRERDADDLGGALRGNNHF